MENVQQDADGAFLIKKEEWESLQKNLNTSLIVIKRLEIALDALEWFAIRNKKTAIIALERINEVKEG